MMDDRSFQEYINYLIRDGAQEVTYEVPREYPDHIKAGNDYASLVSQPGWKRLLDDLELRANQRLARLRESSSADPTEIKHLRDKWVEAEESLKFVQIQAAEAIERRKVIISELHTRLAGLDFDDARDIQTIEEFMFSNNNGNNGNNNQKQGVTINE